jgi:hypothetical protein
MTSLDSKQKRKTKAREIFRKKTHREIGHSARTGRFREEIHAHFRTVNGANLAGAAEIGEAGR